MTDSNPPTFSLGQGEIEEGLRLLGLARGDAVEVHSSLRSLGWVEGGASTVIAALMNAVGRDGTIVMSAYPVSPPIPLTEADKARGITWKVRILPEGSDQKTGLGVVVDEFRQRPDVVCGAGLHRVCAWGRDAERHSRGYRHLLAVDGWVLLLGVGVDRCSSMHIAEETVAIPQEIARLFEIPEDIRRDYPSDAWSIGYGSTPNDPWMTVWEEAQRRGLVRKGGIGKADCQLFRAEAMVSIYEEWRRRDPFGLFGVERGASGDALRPTLVFRVGRQASRCYCG